MAMMTVAPSRPRPDREHAGHAAGAERDLEGVGQRVALGRGGRAHVAAGGEGHADVAGEAGQEAAGDEGERCGQAGRHEGQGDRAALAPA